MRDESEILPLVPPPDRLLQPHVGAPRCHDLPPLKTTRITTSPTTKSRAYQEEAARTRMKKLLCSASGSTCSWFWSQPAIHLKNSAISSQENLAAMCVCVCVCVLPYRCGGRTRRGRRRGGRRRGRWGRRTWAPRCPRRTRGRTPPPRRRPPLPAPCRASSSGSPWPSRCPMVGGGLDLGAMCFASVGPMEFLVRSTARELAVGAAHFWKNKRKKKTNATGTWHGLHESPLAVGTQ